MTTDNVLTRIIFPCAYFTRSVVILLVAMYTPILTAIPFFQSDAVWLPVIVLSFLPLGLFLAQLLGAKHLYAFVARNFQYAHPGCELIIVPRAMTWPIFVALAAMIAITLFPVTRLFVQILYGIIAVVDLLCVATLIGFGLYWRHVALKVVKAANQAQSERMHAGIQVDLGQIMREQQAYATCEELGQELGGFIPVGVICQIDEVNGDVHVGVVALSIGSDEPVIITDEEDNPDKDTIDVDP